MDCYFDMKPPKDGGCKDGTDELQRDGFDYITRNVIFQGLKMSNFGILLIIDHFTSWQKLGKKLCSLFFLGIILINC